MAIITVHELTKRYGSIAALDRVTFEVRAGEILGILGPNGAGKTTTLEILEGLRRPDSGRAIVDGIDVFSDPRAVRGRIGVQLQESGFFDRLTVEETLVLFGSFYTTTQRTPDILNRLQLDDKRWSPVNTLSGGQLRRLSIAVALIHDPRILILDEPTTGLDPHARRALWDVIAAFKHEGRTVLLTTHYMEEAQRLCDRIAIMDHGRIVALDTPRALIRAHAPTTTIVVLPSDDASAFAALPGVQAIEHTNGEVRLSSVDPLQTVHALLDLKGQSQATFHQLRMEEAGLEDVFLQLTGRRLRE